MQNNKIIKTGYNNINNAVIENDLTNPTKNISNNNMRAVINQKVVEEINLGGPKKNIKTPDKNNFATVKKISDTTSNITSAKVKKRALNRNDYENIIYKEVGIINLGNTCFINSLSIIYL